MFYLFQIDLITLHSIPDSVVSNNTVSFMSIYLYDQLLQITHEVSFSNRNTSVQ